MTWYNAFVMIRVVFGLWCLYLGIFGYGIIRFVALLLGIFVLFTEVLAYRRWRITARGKGQKPWEIWNFYLSPIRGKGEVARAGVEVERIIVQVLIAIAGISATFLSRGVLGSALILVSLGCGMIYIFLLRGSIQEEKDIVDSTNQNITRHVLAIDPMLDLAKDVFLNVQFFSLLFGLAILIQPHQSSAMVVTGETKEIIVIVRSLADLRVKENDWIDVNSILAIDMDKQKTLDALADIDTKLQALQIPKPNEFSKEIMAITRQITSVVMASENADVEIKSKLRGRVEKINTQKIINNRMEVVLKVRPE